MSTYLAAYSLSISDLVLDKDFIKAYGENDVPKIKDILWKYGMDVKAKPFEEVFCTHRNLQNQVHTCTRYEGYERLDTEHLSSGIASVYAKIEASKHSSGFKGEMLSLLHQGCTANGWEAEEVYSGEKE